LEGSKWGLARFADRRTLMSSFRVLLLTSTMAVAVLTIGVSEDAFAATPIAKFTLPDATIFDFLGISVATDGQRVLAGSRNGKAYLFDPFTQQQLATLTFPDLGVYDDTSVALAGNTAVIGGLGSAVVYDLSNLSAITSKPLTPGDSPSEWFGGSVAMSGDTIIVGAPNPNGANDAAYLFDRQSGGQYAKLTPNDEHPADMFGGAVAIDGDLAVVGSTNGDYSHSGKVYLYNTQPGFAGDRQLDKYSVSPPPDFNSRQLGMSVAISGDTIMAREVFGESFIWPTSGEPTPLSFTLTGLNGGSPLSISGGVAAVALGEFGEIRFYDPVGTIIGYLPAPPDDHGGFASSIAIGGDLVVVGAPQDLPHERGLYVYRLQDVLYPEPSTFVMALVAFAGGTGARRRRGDSRGVI
jgi:hypothetical protein